MALVRYEPWGLLNKFHNEVGRLYDDMGMSRSNDYDVSNVVTSAWTPAVDIREEDDRFVLYADVPGVDAKDIEVSMDDGVLVIKGERSSESKEEREGYKRVERVRGSFYRRFSLPDNANAENISAKSDKGVLTVVIPKQEKAQPKRIPVA